METAGDQTFFIRQRENGISAAVYARRYRALRDTGDRNRCYGRSGRQSDGSARRDSRSIRGTV